MPDMSNHPNRSRRSRSANPSPDAVIAAREAVGHSQTAAALTIDATLRTWQGWEAPKGTTNHRRMPPAAWNLYQLMTHQHPDYVLAKR